MRPGLISSAIFPVHIRRSRHLASGAGSAATRVGEYGIQFLVDRFRRALISDSIAGFSLQVTAALGDTQLLFLASDRIAAAEQLRTVGADEAADTLLEARAEWYFFTDLSAAFEIYMNRADLQVAFPDILDRDHTAFCDWLIHHATDEHGCSPLVGERFRRCAATATLARIFSYLARRDDVARDCQDLLLSDNMEPALRQLIRGAGEGLEYDLDDVVVLRFIHQTSRYLLVPLYLELPLIRLQPQASRLIESSMALLPEPVRDTGWARRGCEIHAMHFDRFEAYLDDEARRWADTVLFPSRDVTGLPTRSAARTTSDQDGRAGISYGDAPIGS